MAVCLICVKPIPALVLTYCQFDPSEQLVMNFNQNTKIFLDENTLNSLWPCGTIWWHRSGIIVVQVMACCRQWQQAIIEKILTILYWCPVAFNWVQFNRVHKILFSIVILKVILSKLLSQLPGANKWSCLLNVSHFVQASMCSSVLDNGSMYAWLLYISLGHILKI